jgi:nucleoside-diphosphate-sugar epimerase
MISSGAIQGISGVKVLDKLTYAGIKENLTIASDLPDYQFIQGDICDSIQVQGLLTDIDAVINFAAESHVDRSIRGATDFVQTNVVGVQVLLDAIKDSGRDIRFLQVSTDEVYGSIKEGAWTEDWPLQPNSPYSASKASGELLARSYNRTHGMDVVITRCSNNYGTHHFPEKLIPLFITNIIENKNPFAGFRIKDKNKDKLISSVVIPSIITNLGLPVVKVLKPEEAAKIDFSKPKSCIKIGRNQMEALAYTNETGSHHTGASRSRVGSGQH